MDSTRKMTSSSTSTQDLGQGSPLNSTQPHPTTCSTGTETEISPLSPKVQMCSRFVSTWDDADLLGSDCKKDVEFLNHKEIEDDDDEEQEIEATDNLLGRLRRGINIIETHARETMAGCYTEESRQDMEQRLEKSTLKMLKAEKSFLNTARIISEVVDEFADDYEHVVVADEGNEDKSTNGDKSNDNSVSKQENGENDDERVLFRTDMMNSSSISGFRDRMSKIFGEKLTNYEDGLTDDVLRGEKKFKNLQRQIRYGRMDAERQEGGMDLMPGGDGDVSSPHQHGHHHENEERRTAESEGDDDYDEAILPTLDPISRRPITTAVTVSQCHHVFDRSSIIRFINENPGSKCPVEGCLNQNPLHPEQLILQIKLTEQIRCKNTTVYGAGYANF